MSEKATLLTSIPPVEKTDAKASDTPNSIPPKDEGKVSLLSQTRETPTNSTASQTPKSEVVKSTNAAGSETKAVETVASEAVVDEPSEITAFELLTYASFVLNFILAGAAAVILFKKASKLVEERFAVSAKVFAITGVLIMLHGFFATYLYAAHLNDTVKSAPLFLTMAVWILVGPAVGFITRNLLARGATANRKAAFIDAGIYALIFFLTACGVSSGIKANAALLSSILAGFLMIVPIARSLTAFKVAKARHRELNDVASTVLVYGLLLIPALLPILAFAHVCGLGDGITLFLINFITLDFVLIVGLSMIASSDIFIPEEVEVAQQSKETQKKAVMGNVAAESSAKPQTEKIASGNPSDPIIQFLNSEDSDEKPAASAKPESVTKPAAKSTPRPAPPRKPGRPGITPPKKPGSDSKDKPSDSSSSRIKAPAKPKKRF
jgi:hypothetical protein